MLTHFPVDRLVTALQSVRATFIAAGEALPSDSEIDLGSVLVQETETPELSSLILGLGQGPDCKRLAMKPQMKQA